MPSAQPHVFGFMHYCIRCGIAEYIAVDLLLPTCDAPDNVRSLRNEIAYNNSPALKAMDEWIEQAFGVRTARTTVHQSLADHLGPSVTVLGVQCDHDGLGGPDAA